MAVFATIEMHFPIKHKILQNGRFQIYPDENEVSSRKARLRILSMSSTMLENLPWLDYRSNASRFASSSEFLKWKRESLQCLPNLLPFGAECSVGLLNLPNLPFSEFGSQSNTNSESTKATVPRIDVNQTHPKTVYKMNFILPGKLVLWLLKNNFSHTKPYFIYPVLPSFAMTIFLSVWWPPQYTL